MKDLLRRYFSSWWLPALVYLCLLGGFAITVAGQWKPLAFAANVLFWSGGLAFLGLIAETIRKLVRPNGEKVLSVLFSSSPVERGLRLKGYFFRFGKDML